MTTAIPPKFSTARDVVLTAIAAGDRNDFLRYGLDTMTDGATVTLDLDAAEKVHSVVLGDNRILAVSNSAIGERFLLRLVQDATGSRTVTWWSTITWPGGSAPTLTTTANKVDVFEFIVTATDTYECILQTQNIG